MSFIERVTQTGKSSDGPSSSNVVRQFLDAVDHETKTRLDNPDGMTFFDLTELYIASEKEQRKLLGLKGNVRVEDSHMLNYVGKRKRINEISRNGESRREGVQVALGATVADEKKAKEKLLEGIGLR